jgi:hypothetical protein
MRQPNRRPLLWMEIVLAPLIVGATAAWAMAAALSPLVN